MPSLTRVAKSRRPQPDDRRGEFEIRVLQALERSIIAACAGESQTTDDNLADALGRTIYLTVYGRPPAQPAG